MQKHKLILSFALLSCFLSNFVYAADSIPSDGVSTNNSGTTQEVAPAPVQQHMIEMMQDDFAFENQKRALSNELELEKLRGEITIAREKSGNLPAPEVVTPAQEPTEQPVAEATVPTALPKVLLVSDIGGVSRVAISLNNTIKLVKLNEHFTLDGHKFMVFNSGYNMPSIKEITQ